MPGISLGHLPQELISPWSLSTPAQAAIPGKVLLHLPQIYSQHLARCFQSRVPPQWHGSVPLPIDHRLPVHPDHLSQLLLRQSFPEPGLPDTLPEGDVEDGVGPVE